MIAFLTQSIALDRWDEYAQLISASLMHDPFGLTPLGILRMIEADQAYVAVSALDQDIEMVAVFKINQTEQGDYLCLIALAGTNLAHWLEPLTDAAELVARAAKCRGMIFSGRPGWTKVLKSTGFAHAASVMKMEF